MKRMQKIHEKEERMMMQNYGNKSSQGITPQEQAAKTYIESYKNQYPRSSIKTALVNNGNSETDVENWLNKYFAWFFLDTNL